MSEALKSRGRCLRNRFENYWLSLSADMQDELRVEAKALWSEIFESESYPESLVQVSSK
jgi:hypothetical protein